MNIIHWGSSEGRHTTYKAPHISFPPTTLDEQTVNQGNFVMCFDSPQEHFNCDKLNSNSNFTVPIRPINWWVKCLYLHNIAKTRFTERTKHSSVGFTVQLCAVRQNKHSNIQMCNTWITPFHVPLICIYLAISAFLCTSKWINNTTTLACPQH